MLFVVSPLGAPPSPRAGRNAKLPPLGALTRFSGLATSRTAPALSASSWGSAAGAGTGCPSGPLVRTRARIQRRRRTNDFIVALPVPGSGGQVKKLRGGWGVGVGGVVRG